MESVDRAAGVGTPGQGRYRVGPAERIPLGEGKVFSLGGRRVAVFRQRTGEVFAAQATCPHRGGPLADGLVGAGRVICPLHAFAFDLTTGHPLGNACDPLEVYAVVEAETGELIVDVGA